MPITDTSTNIEDTWVENATVSFTAGTLATISACVTEVESKLKRGTLSSATQPTNTQVQNWLIFAKQELAEVKNFDWKFRTATLTTEADDHAYGLPPDYNGGFTSVMDTTNNRKLEHWPLEKYWLKYPKMTDESSDKPLIYTITPKRILALGPPPDGAYELYLGYYRSGDDNTVADFSWLPEIERYRCTHYALWQGFLSIHMWKEAKLYEMQWKEGLGKAIRIDGKRKWQHMEHRAISWQQQYAARNYQSDETT